MDLPSLIDQAFAPPKIDEKIAVGAEKGEVWRWFVEPERFLRWNRDVAWLRWEGDGQRGELLQRRLIGRGLRMRVTLESKMEESGKVRWVFALSQQAPAFALADSSLEYSIVEATGGSILGIRGRFVVKPFPVRRIYGAVATDWIMAGGFRLKALVEAGAPGP